MTLLTRKHTPITGRDDGDSKMEVLFESSFRRSHEKRWWLYQVTPKTKRERERDVRAKKCIFWRFSREMKKCSTVVLTVVQPLSLSLSYAVLPSIYSLSFSLKPKDSLHPSHNSVLQLTSTSMEKESRWTRRKRNSVVRIIPMTRILNESPKIPNKWRESSKLTMKVTRWEKSDFSVHDVASALRIKIITLNPCSVIVCVFGSNKLFWQTTQMEYRRGLCINAFILNAREMQDFDDFFPNCKMTCKTIKRWECIVFAFWWWCLFLIIIAVIGTSLSMR